MVWLRETTQRIDSSPFPLGGFSSTGLLQTPQDTLPLTELAGVDPLLTFEGEGDSSAGFVFLFDAMFCKLLRLVKASSVTTEVTTRDYEVTGSD